MSAFSINYLTVVIILTQYQKVRDRIDTFERLRTKLTYGVKVEDQINKVILKFIYYFIYILVIIIYLSLI